MSAYTFTFIFLFFLTTTTLFRLWLSFRQIRYVKAHEHQVPEQFTHNISLESHQKAARYTATKCHLGIQLLLLHTIVLLGFTLLGGLNFISDQIRLLTDSSMIYQIALILVVGLISSLIDLPFDYYSQFGIEEKFGFNKMTPRLFFIDLLKNTLLSLVIGLPLLWVVLSLMNKAGDFWWFFAWIIWTVFQFTMMLIYPTFIAPLFNKFTPLEDESLKERIERLLEKTGFKSKGLFVMDGSKRSAHGNAYFTGFGASKRIIFYDTLINQLSPTQIEAVLAHELGHFKHKHIMKRMILMVIISFVFLAILGFLKNQDWFYIGLGVMPSVSISNDALALILFMQILPLFTFFFTPLFSMSSRKHEFEADAFSAQYTNANDLVTALVSMYQDNASTLTPDPLYSSFYDSHPNASDRIHHLLHKA